MLQKLITLCLLSIIGSCSLWADSTEVELPDSAQLASIMEAYTQQIDSINKTFTFQKGTVELKDGIATIVIPEKYKFIDGPQADRVLVDLWQNPPQYGSLGMLFLEEDFPVGKESSYVAEISYSEEGFVKDDDADDIDYDELLEQMQEETQEASEARQQEGYPSVELVGWASPPFYDKNTKKLHWAKEIAFGDSELNTLNYNIRILGRKGYINVNIIAEMDQLTAVKDNIDEILSSIEFNEGNTYADFDPDIDEIAAVGIGGLIAGKILAKAGILAKLGVFLMKGWKILVIGVVAAFAAIKKFFTKQES